MNQEQSLNPDAWAQAQSNPAITTEVLDKLVKEMKEARSLYEVAKARSTDLYKEFEAMEGKVVEALTQAGKRKYFVEDIGTVFFIEKLVVATPKTLEDKQKLFCFLRERHGETFLLDKQSINHQSLQKIYNDAYNEAVEAGVGAEFVVPGLLPPTANISLGFRKER